MYATISKAAFEDRNIDFYTKKVDTVDSSR